MIFKMLLDIIPKLVNGKKYPQNDDIIHTDFICIPWP